MLTVNDYGINNRVDISDKERNTSNFVITFTGDNNIVKIGEGTTFFDASISLGDNNRLLIGAGNTLNKLEVFAKSEATIHLGSFINSTWHARLYAHESGNITIGNGCLIASGALITVSDMHSIIDISTNKRINPAEDIVISDRVWLAEGVRVMGGATIGEDTVIGAGAIVTGELPSQSVCVGIPARAIKSGTKWKIELI